MPTDSTGEKNLAEIMENDKEYIDDPRELLGKRIDFNIIIENVIIDKSICKESFIEYSLIINNELERKKFVTDKVNIILYFHNN